MAGLGAWLTGLSDEADVATEAGEDYGKKNNMATGDTAADAVRHMTMAALAVKEHPKWGDTIMQANETLGGGDQRAKRMDEYNNELGIKAFLEIPEDYRKDMSNEEIAAYMTEIVDKEYQYRLKNDGKPSGEGPKFYEKPLVTDGGYDKGGLVSDPWDEDPTMPSEEGLEQGDDITAEDFAYFAASMAPVSGEVISAKEGLEAYEEGDYLGAALGAAGAIPGVGMVGRAIKKGVTKIADDLPWDEVVEYVDEATDSVMKLAKYPDGRVSTLELYVPEEARGQGIGKSLQAQALTDFPQMQGQVSSKAAAKTAYDLGRRPVTNPNATLEETFAIMDDMSSVNMKVPEGAPKGLGLADDVVRNPILNRKTGEPIEGVTKAEVDAPALLGMDDEARAAWQAENKVRQKQVQSPELLEAVEKVKAGEMSGDEFRALAKDVRPPTIFEEVPRMPSLEDIAGSLKSNQLTDGSGVIGVDVDIADGTRIASRLDIPAYENYDQWIVSAHNGAGDNPAGQALGYGQTAVLNDVKFKSNSTAALNIAGGKPKTTIARMFGDWENKDPEEVKALAEKLIDDPDWVQVGMNPYRASYFYDKRTLEPVTEADQVIQVGALVLAKNAKKASPNDPQFKAKVKGLDEDQQPTFNEGGLMAEDETGMPIVGYDEESGNPIPPGSSAENVRDDIPAMLSEGEFVVPADVVKWHGLKHMMEMREEAKEGLMAMHMEDQIKSPEHEVEEEEMVETSSEEMDEHGNEDYPTEMGQMSDIEYGDESLLVLMAADGGEVTSGEETTAPKQRLVRRLVRDPKTGKMIVMFVDIATGKPVARKSVQEGLADGTMETLDQTPQRMFEQMGGEMPEKSTAEEVVEGETGVSMPSVFSGGSGEGVGNSEPVQRTLENNYGFIDPTQRSIAMGVAGMIPGGRLFGSWGINANNTAAVNAARAELGLDPVDTTLGVNMDAATGMVTDQMDPTDDVDVGPFSADVMMTDQIGRTARVADPDNMSTMDKIKDSKAARFFSGKNVTLDDTKDLPYETSSYLTPFEIQEKQAAGLAQRADGTWGYSAGAEQIGRETLADMSQDKFGSDIGLSTADKYGLSLASDRGRQEALGIAAQDAELFDDDGDGKLDADELKEMEEFYAGTRDSGSRGLGYSSDYGSQSEADAVASDGWGSDAHFDAIDAQFDNLPSTGGGSSGGNYSSDTGGGTSGNGSDPGDGGGAISSTADGNDFDNFNKGGLAYKPKQKYASIKK